MGQIGTNDAKQGMKVELDKDPYLIVSCEFVKPGKGQAFARIKLKNMMSGRVIERTFKTGEKLELADVEEAKMRLLYKEHDQAVFMNDDTFDQIEVPLTVLGDDKQWLKDESLYDMVFFRGEIIGVTPPTFMELVITETDPGVRGDTASGRVLKPAIVETGAKVQVPIFIEQGEKIKVDTRTGEYVCRV